MKKIVPCVLAILTLLTGIALAQEYQPPALTQDGAWTMVLVPDTQSYVKFGRNQGILELMTAWIAENGQTLNIPFVLHLGDLVEYNGLEQAPEKGGNQTSAQAWTAVARAMGRLDGKIPYAVCTGNHDYGVKSAENRDTQLPKYFPADKNPLWADTLVECGESVSGEKTLENAAYEFTAPGGQKILVVSLEFAPRDAAIEWAKGVVAQEKFAEHFVIVMTHSYMQSTGNRIVKEGYKVEDANYGEALWQKLIRPSKNIRMVVCGHVARPDDFKGSVGFSQDKREDGTVVSQILFNAQALGGGWHGNGGEGWLRLVEFSPDMKRVRARTFSPLFAISPATRHLAWHTEAYNDFEFSLE